MVGWRAMTNHAAVLSDVHIGNGAPTVWYQPAVHEPYLLSALQWIINNASTISELVLLGDLVDQWTYPPGVQPPSMQQIIDANPNTLGPGGLLAQAVQAIPKTSFLLGNHDGQLQPADLAALQASIGPFTVEDPVYTVEGSTGARTVFSHGHLWTMFNAPDDSTALAPLPVGHYVTRAFSYMMANRLQPGQTVADLPNMGYPDGFNIWQFLQSLSPTLNPDVADMLLDYVASAAQMDEALPIVLPDGTSSSIAAAKGIYADLFTRWVNAEGGSVVNAARAALADGSPPYLAWFAQRLAIQQSADLVVMGHTHQPVSGLSISPINYVNSGFECASAPDNPPKAFSFTVVDLDTASAQIQQVNPGTYAVGPSSAPPMSSAVLPPALDYSSYVRIYNQSSQTLTLSGTNADEGHWVVPPTASIPPGGRGDGWLQDNTGPFGSSGSFSYTQGGTTLPFSCACPTGWASNEASGPGGNFIARSGTGGWQPKGKVPWLGSPLQVQFTITGN